MRSVDSVRIKSEMKSRDYWLTFLCHEEKSSASFEKQCDIVYVNITVYNNVSKYIFTIEFDPICHVAHHSVVTNISDCEVSASLS